MSFEIDPDTLVIEYAELGNLPEERIRLLGLVGRIIHLEAGLYSRPNLDMTRQDWSSLFKWAGGWGQHFYRVEGEHIRVLVKCTKHIIVGTGKLMHDLPVGAITFSKEQLSLKEIWSIARSAALYATSQDR